MHRRLLLPLLIVALAGLVSALPAWASNDWFFSKQWALTKIMADKAWEASAGRGVVVAIIDGGVDPSHPDLKNRVQSTYTCLTSTCTQIPGDSFSDVHGTLVAGVVAAQAGNGLGVASVAPEARIMSLKVCEEDCDGEAVSRALKFAADNGVKVANLSLGDSRGFSRNSNFGPDIKDAWDKGVVVVAASGNADVLISSYGGAFAPFVVIVGATGPNDEEASYSSGMSSILDVDLHAPGGNPTDEGCNTSVCVITTVPGAKYGSAAGTSLAAPHVAGVAALLRCQGHSAESTVDTLRNTADETPQGLRRVNAAKAVAARPAANCGAIYPEATGSAPVATTTKRPGSSTTAPAKQSGGQQAQSAANQSQQGGANSPKSGSAPSSNLDDEESLIFLDPEIEPAPGPIDDEQKKAASPKLPASLGIGAVVVAAVAGLMFWARRRRASYTDD